MNIRLAEKNEQPPMQLLLLADPSPQLVNDYIKRGQCVVIEEKEEVIGVYVLLPTRPETVELVNIAVAESQQNRGIGKQLVRDAIVRAKQAGYKTIEISTGNSSIGQLALYQKCGFRIVGVDQNFFLRHYEEEIYENGIQCVDMIRLSRDV
ncbi:GNAT family N-acetyltransferase [Metabacillus iocasae]|uniref:Ribosomal protein S18 acetylase RimI-like enzyme n=1 Tax=Priestia iocasae TaxID=2291674 RepID=A0ABS2QTR5_9BACI|nr:GNAT family N-acetyltransferase [Metabacillus iocasae]MBM7702800.1 ribosomal protein S18 acetylase RimI-like enzyme [Metabacillus iocasae]